MPINNTSLGGCCPFDCTNKNSLGYCQTTACINPLYNQISYTQNFTSCPCLNCLNNPANGGSGICHCILGSQIKF